MASRMVMLAVTTLALFQGTYGTIWAQFCDDNACSVNCGASVAVNNPGCLDEYGRGSIAFHGDIDLYYSLVMSPGPDCPCQDECIEGIVYGGVPDCYDLAGHTSAESFRFVGQSCDANNC